MIRAGFLSTAERRALEASVRSQLEDHGVARRANAILLLDDGKSCQVIAEELRPRSTRHLLVMNLMLVTTPDYVPEANQKF